MSTTQEPLRNNRGEFATTRPDVDLYKIIRDVARLAVELGDDPLKDPVTLSQEEWNRSAAFLTEAWGEILDAHAICARLRDDDDRPHSWPKLLAVALDPSTDFTQYHAQRRSKPDRQLGDDHVFWALNDAAAQLELRTLREADYEAGRKRRLDLARRNPLAYSAAERALPTANQIVNYCGSWDRALEIAELESRDSKPILRLDALAVTEAMTLFYRRNGYLPSQKALTVFLRDEGLACQSWQRRPWKDWCVDATDEIEAAGLPRPNPYPSKTPPPEWKTANLDKTNLPRRNKRNYTRLEVLEAVHQFALNTPAAEMSDRRYKAYVRGKAGLPSLKKIIEYGGLEAFLSEVNRPGWHERARREQEELEGRIEAVTAAAAAQKEAALKLNRQRRRELDPERRMKILFALRDQGSLGSRDLASISGTKTTSRMGVCKRIQELQQRGLVEPTEKAKPRSPNQRYRLTVAGQEALQDEETLRELLSWPMVEAIG